jgi:hypothetical protein
MPRPKALASFALCAAAVVLLGSTLPVASGSSTGHVAASPATSGAPAFNPLAASRAGANPALSTLYQVTIFESGLPVDTVWSLDFNGTVNFTSKSSLTYEVTNGSYAYAAGPAVGDGTTFVASQAYGSLLVAGGPKTRTLHFQPVAPLLPWEVTFTESGLEAGSAWSVTLNGSTEFSSSTSLSIPAANGSYEFGVSTVGSYIPSPGFGTVTVVGTNMNISIKFTAPTVLGLPPAEGFAVFSIGLTLVLLFLGITVLMFRQRRLRRQRRRNEPSPARAPIPANPPESARLPAPPPGPPPSPPG